MSGVEQLRTIMTSLSQTVFLRSTNAAYTHTQTDRHIHTHTHDDSINEIKCVAFRLQTILQPTCEVIYYSNSNVCLIGDHFKDIAFDMCVTMVSKG